MYQMIWSAIEDKAKLLIKLHFAWDLLPPNTIVKRLTQSQLQYPLFNKQGIIL